MSVLLVVFVLLLLYYLYSYLVSKPHPKFPPGKPIVYVSSYRSVRYIDKHQYKEHLNLQSFYQFKFTFKYTKSTIEINLNLDLNDVLKF